MQVHRGTSAVVAALLALAFPVLLHATTRTHTHDNRSNETHSNKIHSKVIYGDDDRHDVYDIQDPALRELADSTAIQFVKASLTDIGNNQYLLHTKNYREANTLCKGERFEEQNVAGYCSAFLVAPTLLVTAGHCVPDATRCSEAAYAFGYSLKTAADRPEYISKSEVYSCKRIVAREQNNSGADFAVIELDRAVRNHKPLKLRRSGQIRPGEGVFVIGNPAGLPTKFALNAKVRSHHGSFFRTNADVYVGNSGSAVFNTRTREVEGIVVRGVNDWMVPPSGQMCWISRVCAEDGCRGEDETSIAEVLPHVP